MKLIKNKQANKKWYKQGLLFGLFLFPLLATAQIDCDESVVPPTILDGVSVTSTWTGSVSTYPTAWTSCGFTTPPVSIYVGAAGAFTYTFDFSEPVNDLVFIITATGTGTDEVFTVTVDGGDIPDVIDEGSCFTTVAGNVITSGALAGPDGGGGAFRVNNPAPYTAVTISGPGGASGSLVALCSNSVVATSGYETTNVTCNGDCDGSATVLEGEAPPYTFLWDAEAGGGTDITAEDLCAGTYEVEVTDGDGVVETLVITITEPDAVEGTILLETDISCFGETDGAITIGGSGGTGDLTYDIGEGPVASGEFTGLGAGTHTITVTDENGCTAEIEVELVEPSEIVVTETITDGVCNVDCSGEIVLEATGGVGPYTFSIDDCATSEAVGTFTDLCENTYEICIEDDNGCQYTSEIYIMGSIALDLEIEVFNEPTCYGFSDGSVTVTSGVGDADYVWVPDNPVEGATYNSMNAGTYWVYASSGDCIDSLEITVGQPDSLHADISITNPLCYGDSTGSAVIRPVYNAQGDLDNISFYWAPNYFGDEGVGVDSAYGMPAGDYTVTINDDNGCSNVIDFTITEPTELVFSELGFEPAYCRLFGYQSGNGVVFAAASGGTPDYTYEWTNEDGDITDNSTWGGLNPGPCTIDVTDANGCVLTAIVVVDSLNPIAAFTVNSDQLNTDCEGTELAIVNFVNESENFANPNNPSSDTSFFWHLGYNNASWYLTHDFFEVVDTVYPGEAVYEVCLVAANKNGCTDTTCKTLIVHEQPEFIAPNIFSPDEDGINDLFTFEFSSAAIKEFQCVIVNRWGVVVAEMDDITQGWDGTDRNGDDCLHGVYFYTYEAVSTNNSVFKGQGTVQLVR
ncbi:MAG: T9SS type B sorting domain-containing protein [Crocinitomix sp.]|nr:T9SS type B sorting domain-containing protein [Crocinitomix sp.]